MTKHFSQFILFTFFEQFQQNKEGKTKKGDYGTFRNRLFCRGGGTRTHDLCVPNAALYQLSHTPIVDLFLLTVPLGRLELPTFSSGNYCSIH